jgi:MSHA pilin protein MshA
MKQIQRGFTLIELVMVIVILGVLAAVAIPKFVDLKGDAELSALKATAGAAAAAATINYAACAAGSSSCVPGITTCTGLSALLSGDGFSLYTVTGALNSGTAAPCTIVLTGKTTIASTFQGIGS